MPSYIGPTDQPVLVGYTDDGLFIKHDYPGQPTHLGGHGFITNMDTPALDYLVKNFDIKEFIDLGCGGGGMSEYAEKCNLWTASIDGDPAVNPGWVIDFSNINKDSYPLFLSILEEPHPKRLVWSTEFVEHVAEEFVPNFMPIFACADVILLSHGLPNQFGHHHVNNRPGSHWIQRMQEIGFIVDDDATASVRNVAASQFVRQSGLVFIKAI